MVLFILAVVWAIYLVSWLRNRTEDRRTNSISSFSKHLSVLERATPGASRASSSSLAPVPSYPSHPLAGPGMARRPTLSPAKKRRRDILFGLGAATGVTFLGALLMGGLLTVLFVLSLLLTVAYVVLLVQMQKRVVERRHKVRPLPGRPVAPASWSTSADEGWYESGTHGAVYAVNGH